MNSCNKDCSTCRYLNGRTDDKGYPFAWECLKYELSEILTPDKFKDSKQVTYLLF